MVENQTGRTIKKLRTGNGLEYLNEQFNSYCVREGIVMHKSVRKTPQQNRLAERMNRTLLESVRCMLFSANLHRRFLGEAVTTVAYLINRSPSTAIDLKTPEEVWSGTTPKHDNLRVFGCVAYA